MTDSRQIGTVARDELLEDAIRRLDAYRVERTLAEKPGLLTELATWTGPDSSTVQVMLKHIALELANPLLWKRYRLADTSHLPELMDVIELPDECVVVLQFIAGMSLAAYVERMGAISPSRARSIMDDLCDAASALSSVGIVHRDIKPSNVILSPKGAYLIDPGIARISDNHSYEGPHDHDTVVLGTYGYAPPEQLGYAQTDARSDVFSLARVLGYMLTGIAPTEPAFLEALRGDRRIPDGLRLVISRACSLEPSLRPANAQALKRQIDANVSSRDTGIREVVDVHPSGGATGRPVSPLPHAVKVDGGQRTLAERREPVETPRTPDPMPERAIDEPRSQEMSGPRRAAIRFITGFFGFFGTVIIIAGFSMGDRSLPGWGNILFGLDLGIFWNYLPAFELVQSLKGVGRYRTAGFPSPAVFKRLLIWFGIGFAITGVITGLMNLSGYQSPQ